MIRLRGHHLFCLSLFAGKGYSGDFVKNMRNIQKQQETDGSFLLLERDDDVCLACPNLLPGSRCLLGTENVLDRDRAAIEVLGLAAGELYRWGEIAERLAGITEEEFEVVCGKCRWKAEGLCSREKLIEAGKRLRSPKG